VSPNSNESTIPVTTPIPKAIAKMFSQNLLDLPIDQIACLQPQAFDNHQKQGKANRDRRGK